MTARIRLLLAAFATAGIAACGGDQAVGPPTPVVAVIQVTPGTDTLLTLGRTRQFAAQARDANGNPVNAVTFVWRSSNPAVATVDSVTGIVTAVGNGLSVIRAVASGVTGQATLAVAQVVATVQVTPGGAAFSAVGDTQRFAAVAKDSGGANVQGVRFLWGSSNGNAVTIDTLGLATSRGSGQAIISATGRGIPGYATVNATQAATQLVITVEPGNVIAGAAFNPAIAVEARDARGAVVTGFRGAVTLALRPRAAQGTLHGSTTVNAAGGVAGFSGLWVDLAKTGYQLIATSAAVPAADTSAAFAVAAGPPAIAYFQQAPTKGEGNVFLPPFQVNVVDAFGNPADATVEVGFGSRPWADANLDGNTALGTVAGAALFDSVKIDRPGAYTLLVSVSQGTVTLPTFESHGFAVALHFSSMAAGMFATCGSTAGGVYCWGYPYDSVPHLIAAGQVFDSLAAGDYHMCGHQVDNTVWCWGENTAGQLGTGSAGGTASSPVLVTGGHSFTQVVTGHLHTCALTPAGAAYCWGSNSSGQLGDSTTTQRAAPVPVAGGRTFSELAAGGSHTCALTADTLAYCWGANAKGQLGNGSVTRDSAPHAVAGPFVAHSIVASDLSTCAESAGGAALYCWGDNSYGELGDFGPDASAPRLIGANYDNLAGSLGAFFCGSTGPANVCWGNNTNGQLGSGFPPVLGQPVGGGVINFDLVRAGGQHACGLSASYGMYCWGGNVYGQLGTGNTLKSYSPVPVLQ